MKSALFVTTLPPLPARSGGRQRSAEFLRELSRLVRVTLLFPDGEGGDETELHFAKAGVEVVRGLPPRRGPLAWTDGYFRDYPFHFAPYVEAVEGDFLRLAPEHDLVYLDHLHMAPLAALAPLPGARLILDEHNVEGALHAAHAANARGPLRLLRALYARSVARFERRILERFDRVLCPAAADRELLLRGGADPARTLVVGNGAHPPVTLPPPAKERVLLHVGSLSWAPAVAGLSRFYRKVYRRLRARLPDLAFVVAGAGPVAPELSELLDDPSVRTLVDFDSPRDVYALGNVCVAPSVVPGGTKIKTAEALLHGRHVACTREAAEGFGERAGLSVAEGVEALEAPLHRLLTRNALPPLDRPSLDDLTWGSARAEFRRHVGELLA